MALVDPDLLTGLSAPTPDPVAAVVALLRDNPTVAALTGGRVYGAELPELDPDAPDQPHRTFAASMPRACAVVGASGGGLGPGALSFIRVSGVRMDVRSYGQTPGEASAVHWAVYQSLHQMRPQTVGACRLLTATVAGGPVSMRDHDGHWPMVLGVYIVTAAETAVA